MLTDVLIPMLTYPDKADPGVLAPLSEMLGGFATVLTFCAVATDVPDMADRWGSSLISLPQMVAEVEQRSRQNAADLLSVVSELGSKSALERSTIKAAFGNPGPAIVRQARNHDLTALVMKAGSSEHAAVAEEVLFGSGRPVLLVPETLGSNAGISKVAVAWDGSTTASSALFDAMPLIAASRKVILLTADEDKPVKEPLLEAVVGYMRRHGVDPEVRNIPASRRIGVSLQEAALSNGAGLLVMGAYGHSRLREFVLGGATADVLSGPLLPIFMSR